MPSLTVVQHRWFFFYGTLRHDCDNIMTRALLPLLTGGQLASVQGQLRTVCAGKGFYPALCKGHGRVLGRLYRARREFGTRQLRLLDAYEDYDKRRPGRCEYARQIKRVRVAGSGYAMAQVYVYQRPVHQGLRIIPGGDFARHAVRHRLPVFQS